MLVGWVKRRLILRELKKALERLDKEGKLNVIKGFIGSKKAVVVFAGILTVLGKDLFGLSPETVQQVVELVMTFVVGQGAVDVALVMKGRK